MIATVTLNPSLDEWIHVPSLRVGALNRATGFARYPGGKGINVSRVIHELGGRTAAYALAGGMDGQLLRTLLKRLGIRCEFVPVAQSTRNNYKLQTDSPRAITELNTAGPAVSRAALQALRQRLLRAGARCVVLSGSLPPGAPASIYRAWIAALRRLGIPAVLDASGEAMRLGVAARPWLIKPNRQEAEELLGRPLGGKREHLQALQRLLRLGAEVVILSLGAEGALMATASAPGIWWGRPPRVRAVSSVGAGDSLVGGFVWSWMRQPSLVEAFRWGVASGTATVMTPGTELCHRADVYRVRRRVAIRRLAE